MEDNKYAAVTSTIYYVLRSISARKSRDSASYPICLRCFAAATLPSLHETSHNLPARGDRLRNYAGDFFLRNNLE